MPVMSGRSLWVEGCYIGGAAFKGSDLRTAPSPDTCVRHRFGRHQGVLEGHQRRIAEPHRMASRRLLRQARRVSAHSGQGITPSWCRAGFALASINATAPRSASSNFAQKPSPSSTEPSGRPLPMQPKTKADSEAEGRPTRPLPSSLS